jgi:hypothetical protein
VGAAPAIASDGGGPLSEEIVVGDALDTLAPVDDATALPVEPAIEGAPADGGADGVTADTESGISGGAEAAGNALVEVISDAVERDITPVVADPVPSTDAVPDAPTVEHEQGRPDATTPVEQTLPASAFDEVDAALGGAGEVASPSPDRPRETQYNAAGSREDPQYQDDSPQYQSAEISDTNSWKWEWYLELDCTGITSSTSNEIGTSASSDWTWVWNWNWTCGLDGASERAAEEMGQAFPPRPDPAAGDETATGAADSDQAAGSDPAGSGVSWLWTWTFTFCGNTTTIVTPVAIDDSLRWFWEWTWNWACTTSPKDDADPSAGEDIGDDATTPESEGIADATPSLPWIDEIVWFDEPIETTTSQLLAYAPSPAFPLPPAAAPLTLDAPRPAHTTAAPARVPTARPPSPTLTTGATAALEPRAAAAAPERATVRKAPARTDASPKRHRPHRWPLDTSPRGIAGAPASSGSAPGGTGAGSVAALTGFLVLAAPGLGRRIREARELSPRAPVRDRLERPG